MATFNRAVKLAKNISSAGYLTCLMINEIIEEVRKRADGAEGNIAEFSDRKCRAIAFSQGNYRDIGKGTGKTLLFVDGGNCEILSSPGMSLQLIRNAAVVMKGNKMLSSRKREFYALAATEGSEGRKRILATIYSGNETETAEGKANTGIGAFCDSLRKASEIKFAIEMVNRVEEGGIVVLDGTLEAVDEMEKRHFDELYIEAAGKGATVAALAKTTGIMTDKGGSFAAMLSARGPEKEWYYHPVAEINSEYHNAEMLFAKLNEKSNHVFRTEVCKGQRGRIPEIVAELKENSRELTFPGYPYGLIMADRLARVSEKEADYIKAKMFAAAGSKWKNVKRSIAAVDAHDILDRM